MTEYAVLFFIVFGVNLMPAFGPPTWTIIALYALHGNLPIPVTVLIGALGAASGRYVLARGFRYLARYLPASITVNLDAVRKAIEQRRRNLLIGLGLFALSPLPSAQLFEAAGLAGVGLRWFTASFFFGRAISYSVYAYTFKTIKATSLGEAFHEAVSSPYGLLLQVLMIALLTLFLQFNWTKFLDVPQAPDPKRR